MICYVYADKRSIGGNSVEFKRLNMCFRSISYMYSVDEPIKVFDTHSEFRSLFWIFSGGRG